MQSRDIQPITGERQDAIEELTRLEGTISRGITVFYEVGAALAAIREKGLFRIVGYAKFEDYCQAKWGWGDSRAKQLIAASKVISAIRAQDALDGRVGPLADGDDEVTIVTPRPLPRNEAQTRELNRAPPDELVESWDETRAEHGKRVTAKHLALAVNKRKAATGDRAFERQQERQDIALFGVPEETRERRIYRLNQECERGLKRIHDALAVIDPAVHVAALSGENRGDLRRQVREVKAWCAAIDDALAHQLPLIG